MFVNSITPVTLPQSHIDAIHLNNKEIENILHITRGTNMTIEDADKQASNPNFNIGIGYEGYNVNCQTCIPTYLLRLRGFNVKAGEMTDTNLSGKLAEFSTLKGGKIVYHCWDCYLNIDKTPVKPMILHDWIAANKIKTMSPELYLRFLYKATLPQGIYEIAFKFKNKAGGGHHVAILHKCQNGNLYYLDPQYYNGMDILIPVEEIVDLIDIKKFGGILRIDDKLINTKYLDIFLT